MLRKPIVISGPTESGTSMARALALTELGVPAVRGGWSVGRHDPMRPWSAGWTAPGG